MQQNRKALERECTPLVGGRLSLTKDSLWQAFLNYAPQREHALYKAQSIVSAAETAKRPLTDNEQMEINTAMLAVQTLNPRIAEIEKKNTVTKMLGTIGGRSVLLIDGARRFPAEQDGHSLS